MEKEKKELLQQEGSGLEQILYSLFDKIKEIVKSETIISRPVQLGRSSIITLSKIKIGFMAGSRNKNEIGASGGALSVEPVGILVVGDEGKAFFYSMGRPQSMIVEKVINLIPEVAEKIIPELKERFKKALEEKKEQETEEQK